MTSIYFQIKLSYLWELAVPTPYLQQRTSKKTQQRMRTDKIHSMRMRKVILYFISTLPHRAPPMLSSPVFKRTLVSPNLAKRKIPCLTLCSQTTGLDVETRD